MTVAQRRFFPNLDALRFFAFLAVFVTHVLTITSSEVLANPHYQRLLAVTHLGFLGVDFFFVLSSFLITWIVLEERARTGEFAVRKFWIRRTLRIWPLYFAAGLSAYGAIWWVSPQEALSPPSIVWLFTFTVNAYMAAHGNEFLLALGMLWSISVEEQFYLGWALVLNWLDRYLRPLSMVLILVSLAWCVSVRDRGAYSSFSTPVFFQHFAVGALLALTAHERGWMYRRLERMSVRWIVLGYCGGFLALAGYRFAIGSTLAMIPWRFGIVLFFGFVIFEQSFCRHSPLKVGGWQPIDYLGRISYGLYVCHGVAISAAVYLTAPTGTGDTLLQAIVLYPLAILAATVGAAATSYECYERPFLRLRTRFYAA